MIAVDSSIHLFKQRPLTSQNIEDSVDDRYERNFEIKAAFINPLAESFSHSHHLCVYLLRFSVKRQRKPYLCAYSVPGVWKQGIAECAAPPRHSSSASSY